MRTGRGRRVVRPVAQDLRGARRPDRSARPARARDGKGVHAPQPRLGPEARAGPRGRHSRRFHAFAAHARVLAE